jgi:ribosomal protein S17E
MLDYEVRKCKNEIVNYLNHTELPIEVKRLILSEILNETTRVADNDIRAYVTSLNEEQKSNPENSPE